MTGEYSKFINSKFIIFHHLIIIPKSSFINQLGVYTYINKCLTLFFCNSFNHNFCSENLICFEKKLINHNELNKKINENSYCGRKSSDE